MDDQLTCAKFEPKPAHTPTARATLRRLYAHMYQSEIERLRRRVNAILAELRTLDPDTVDDEAWDRQIDLQREQVECESMIDTYVLKLQWMEHGQ